MNYLTSESLGSATFLHFGDLFLPMADGTNNKRARTEF